MMLILESTARDRTLVIKLYFCIVSQIILVFEEEEDIRRLR